MGLPQRIVIENSEGPLKRPVKEVDPQTPPKRRRTQKETTDTPSKRVSRSNAIKARRFVPIEVSSQDAPKQLAFRRKGPGRPKVEPKRRSFQSVRCFQEGRKEFLIEVGDTVEVEAGKRPVVGEICELFQDEDEELKMLIRLLLGPSHMEQRCLNRDWFQDRELVDTQEWLEIPLCAMLEKVIVMSEQDYFDYMEDDTVCLASLNDCPFFCRRQLGKEGSKSTWAVEWNDENRWKQRQEVLRKARPELLKAAVGVSSSPKELLQRAATALRVGAAAGDLPGREAEQERVMDFLRSSVQDGGRREVLYVSGVPGTGKTASVLEVVRRLRIARKSQQIQSIYVNAMSLATPRAVFGEIWRQAKPDDVKRDATEAEVRDSVRKAFSQKDKQVTILLIDEVDALLTKAQSVLYQIFDLVSQPSTRLAVVAIANTMDLPERLLPRVASRIGVRRVSFNAYSKDQLKTILVNRLRAHHAIDSFQDKALTFLAARVAGDGGDARKALQVCQKALQARISKGLGQVTFEDITGAEEDLLQLNPAAMAITGLPQKAQQLLLALVMELKKQSAHVAPLPRVLKRYEAVVQRKQRVKAAELNEGDVDVWEESWRMRLWDEGKSHLLPRLQAVGIISLNKTNAVDGVENGTGEGGPGAVLELGQTLDVEEVMGVLASSLDEATELLESIVPGA